MTPPNATLVFSDGATRSFPVPAGYSVVRAAQRHRLMLLTDCREGACGTCRAVCSSGRFSLEDYSDDALPAADREAGGVLLCQMRLESDCVIELGYPVSQAERKPAGG